MARFSPGEDNPPQEVRPHFRKPLSSLYRHLALQATLTDTPPNIITFTHSAHSAKHSPSGFVHMAYQPPHHNYPSISSQSTRHLQIPYTIQQLLTVCCASRLTQCFAFRLKVLASKSGLRGAEAQSAAPASKLHTKRCLPRNLRIKIHLPAKAFCEALPRTAARPKRSSLSIWKCRFRGRGSAL